LRKNSTALQNSAYVQKLIYLRIFKIVSIKLNTSKYYNECNRKVLLIFIERK